MHIARVEASEEERDILNELRILRRRGAYYMTLGL